MPPKTRLEQERREGKQVRKNSLINAAEKVFMRKGLEKTTMQEIADEENIGIATVFRYFPKKDKLIVAVAVKIIESQISTFQSVADLPCTCMEKLDKLFDHFISFIEPQHLNNTRFIEAFESYAAQSSVPLADIELYNAAIRKFSGVLTEIIITGRIDGSIRSDITIQDTLSSLIHAFGIVSKKLSMQKSIVMLEAKLPPETQLAILKTIFLDYLKPPTRETP